MKLKNKLVSILIGVALLSTAVACSNQNNASSKQIVTASTAKKSKKTVHKNYAKQITDKDVVGTWVNHINKDIHQKIVFHKNHTWNENQHGVTNIYHGTWEITGKRKINLQPWNEDIVFSKNNFRKMIVVSFDHVLTKNK